MTISVRLSDKDTELIKAYADMNNISLSYQKKQKMNMI